MNGWEGLIRIGGDEHVPLEGCLTVPDHARGAVLFAHGSGSSRLSPRIRAVAHTLNRDGFATLLLDLLTPDEERVDMLTSHLRFDVEMLARRLLDGTDWIAGGERTARLPIAYFGDGTGAAAALIAAAKRPRAVTAVVSRGGRPDLAGAALTGVRAPTLLVVGDDESEITELNRRALRRLPVARLEIMLDAGQPFEQPEALEALARLTSDWFAHHGGRRAAAA